MMPSIVGANRDGKYYTESSPMNEAKACSGPPYPGVYSDGKGHSVKITYQAESHGAYKPLVCAIPTSPLSQCAFIHSDGDPDFQCSFRPKEGSKYCPFHITAVAGEVTRAKAVAYDGLKAMFAGLKQPDSNSWWERVNMDVINLLLSLSLRNTPDEKKEK